jgi:outer membrane protein assembly factor BamB
MNRTAAFVTGVLLLGTVFPADVFAEDWPQFQHDQYRTGRTSDQVAPPYRVRWCWLGPTLTIRNRRNTSNPADPDLIPGDIIGAEIALPTSVPQTFSGMMQPIIAGGRVFVGDLDGRVYAINENDGTTLWVASNPGGTYFSGACAGSVVVFASVTGYVTAFNTATGATVWSSNVGPVISAPVTNGAIVCIGSTDRRVYAKNIADGSGGWVSPDLGGPIVGGLAMDDQYVYVGAENMMFYQLNISNGQIARSIKVSGQSFQAQWPVIHSSFVFVSASPIVCIGSEYVGEDVMGGATSVANEMARWRQFLQGQGGFTNASPDWKFFTVLRRSDFTEPYLVPMGPFDGCGQPPDPPAVDNQGRIWGYFKSRWNYFARSCGFGTAYQVDLRTIDLATGDCVIVNNGRVADGAWYAWETDNLYGLSFGGNYMYLRQHFRGTQAINYTNTNARAVSNLYHVQDGGTWLGDIQYANNYENGDRVPTTTMRGMYNRQPVSISNGKLYICETFCVTAAENHQ